MDPQWNIFQPPISESAVLDYNRPYNLTQTNNYASQNSNVYNGFYDSSPSSSSSSSSSLRNSKPSSSSSSMISSNPYSSSTSSSSSYFGSAGASRMPSHSQMPPRSPDPSFSQSNYYSSNNSSSSSSQSQYVPPISDFKIGTFTLNSNGFASESNSLDSSSSYSSQNNSSYQQNNGSSSNNQSVRETGIIEKLLQTYGFIQCCERQARLFFHFSQFDGNTEHLRIGDPVEFEVTFDRRTGKPIASSVTKISPEVVLSEERVIGIVTTELKSEHSGEQQGRITYENRGECFFLPYCKEDVEGYVTLKPGDKVSFQIATNQRSGNLAARHVRLENPVEPVKYQGVVSAIKDSYGFIERADVVDEIFFHFSETKTIPGGLKLGDDVEFLIQTRNVSESKEVATNMVKLPPGTVVFEDVNPDEIRGQVLKPVEKARQNQKDPLTGRIRYRGKDRSEVEVKFGERDQKGDFSLRHGDWVKFNIATDRRDHLQKATNISLLDESFNVSGEKREQGLISALKDGFGFIKCAEREARTLFHYNELLDPQREICLGEEVEFTVTSSDQTVQSPNRLSATRIRILSSGTVKFEVLIQENLQGEVTFEPCPLPNSPTSSDEQTEPAFQPGIISFSYNNIKQTINYYPIEGKKVPQMGDKVEFNMYLIKRTKEHVAMDMKILPSVLTSVTPSAMTSSRQNIVGSGRTFDRGGQQPPVHTGINSHPFGMELITGNFFHSGKVRPVSPVPVREPTVAPSFSKPNMESPLKDVAPPVNGVKPDSENSITEISSSDSESDTSDSALPPPPPPPSKSPGSFGPLSKGGTPNNSSSSRTTPVHKGFIATLKDSFGFIETANHDKEIFFHFSNLDGNVNDLDLGQEVEYTIASRTGPGGKLSAENVRVLPLGTLPTPKILGKVYEGTVLRSMRSVNPDQQEYCGLVCVGKEEEKVGKHQFGITGLVNKKELLQPADLVTFQLDEDGWAVNIRAVRKKLVATVETIKGQYGFLNNGTDEGKRVFFHQSEVKDNVTLSPGDEVQFVIITNQKTGKSSACNVTRMLTSTGPSQRPDRLVSKLKCLTMDSSKPRIQLIRNPRGPDGTKGFKVSRIVDV